MRQDVLQRPDATTALSFERTVPRSDAHRAALGEVFVADSLQTGEDEYLLAVQIPRAHGLWWDRQAPYHDPMATAEAARQGAFVIVHRHLGVPHGTPFSLRRFGFHVESLDAYRDDERSPLQGVLRFSLARSGDPRASSGGLSYEGELAIGGSRAMRIGGEMIFVSSDDYAALRAYQRRRKPLDGGTPVRAPEPLDAGRVGRLDRRNVVVAEPAEDREGELRCRLIIDRRHPSFFDHAYDHVPGPLIGEGFRQTAILAALRANRLSSPVVAIVGCEATFSDFGELEAPLECSAYFVQSTGDGLVRVDVGLHQFGQRIAEGQVELSGYGVGGIRR